MIIIRITLLAGLIFFVTSAVSAQIYTPNSQIQGASGSNNVGINQPEPNARLHISDDANSCDGLILIDSYSTSAEPGGGEDPEPENGTEAGGELGGGSCNTPYVLQVNRNHDGVVKKSVELFSNGSLQLGPGIKNYANNNTTLSSTGNIGLYSTNTKYFKMGYFGASPRFTWNHPTPSSSDADLIFAFNENLQASYNEVLRITPTGTMGIGTSDFGGDYKLYVGGKVLCEELTVKLQQDWPDYVFDPNYDRMSLKETEEYISIHGHLPGVPSAEEVEKNGVDLGQMNALLLEKVEELTLELIELRKEMDSLK